MTLIQPPGMIAAIRLGPKATKHRDCHRHGLETPHGVDLNLAQGQSG